MSLASPGNLIWLLAALPIVAFYILKTRLRRRPVSTLLFWDQIFEQKRQRSLWQRLRHWLSLALQLAFLGLLTLALAEPLWTWQADRGQELVLVVDRSASMQVRDPGSEMTRFERAIEKAKDIAGTLRQGDQIALITAGAGVDVVVGMSDFAPTVTEALDQLEPTDGPSELADAIAAARRLASDSQRRRIVIVSDGGVERRQRLEMPHDESPASASAMEPTRGEGIPVSGAGPEGSAESSADQAAAFSGSDLHGSDLHWVRVGQSRDNVAITTFQVRRSIVDPIGYVLLVEVQNFSRRAVATRLTLELGTALVDVLPIELQPGGTFRRQVRATSASGGVLVGTLGDDDALAVDNVARAILPERAEIPVRLVSESESSGFYLRRVLESIPRVRLVTADQQGAPAASASADSVALTVFASVVPEVLPAGPMLLVDLPGDGPRVNAAGQPDPAGQPAWRLGPRQEAPIVAEQQAESPLLRHVRLQSVVLAGGRDLEFNAAVGQPTTLLTTASGARVAVAVERGRGRMLLLAADLSTGELPLRIAFPVMMTNAINWFLRESGELKPALATGQVATLPWQQAAPSAAPSTAALKTAHLIGPRGRSRLVSVDREQARVGPLQHVGLYRLMPAGATPTAPQTGTERNGVVRGGEAAAEAAAEAAGAEVSDAARRVAENQEGWIAVNLANANESDLRVPAFSQATPDELPPARRSPWFYLVLTGLGLMLVEWGLFQRRVVA